MKILKLVALASLLLTLIPPFLHLAGVIDFSATKTFLLVGMIIWALTATPWLAFDRK